MRVILVRDYEKLGGVGDIVNVKDGYAKNYLIPNNIAQVATAGNIKQMEIVKKSFIKKEAKNIEEASKIGEIIDGMQIKFMVNASPEGKLYGSITNKDIAEKILEEKKVDIDRKKIELEGHIKELGLYDIVVKLYKDVKAVLKVEVASEDFVEGADKGAAEEDAAAATAKVIKEESSEEVAEYKPGTGEEKMVDEEILENFQENKTEPGSGNEESREES